MEIWGNAGSTVRSARTPEAITGTEEGNCSELVALPFRDPLS